MFNSKNRYGAVAMVFHWLIAVAIITLLVVGKYMVDLPNSDPNKFALYQLHKSSGLTVLALSIGRILWRLINVVPPPPVGMPVWQRWAASASHLAFYVLIIAIPLSGWSGVSTSPLGIPTIWFGLFEVPSLPGLVGGDAQKDLHEQFVSAHELLGNSMILLLILHVGAALKHHFWDRDTVLTRMLPFTKLE
jgi:cytochrome b561